MSGVRGLPWGQKQIRSKSRRKPIPGVGSPPARSIGASRRGPPGVTPPHPSLARPAPHATRLATRPVTRPPGPPDRVRRPGSRAQSGDPHRPATAPGPYTLGGTAHTVSYYPGLRGPAAVAAGAATTRPRGLAGQSAPIVMDRVPRRSDPTPGAVVFVLYGAREDLEHQLVAG